MSFKSENTAENNSEKTSLDLQSTHESDSHFAKDFAKKSLGQNFLKSERALLDMVSAGDIQEGETIIEIGPGKGALTTKLIEKIKQTPGTRLVCIEKDDRLIPFLKETYKEAIQEGTLEIIHGDIIDILKDKELMEKLSVSKLSISNLPNSLQTKKYKVIANIPYYITGLIFRGIFELDHLPEKIVLLVQKEVANRIMAYGDNGKTGENQGKESILSISIKLYGTPRRVSIVPRGAFVPSPTVDSAIIAVEHISRKIPKEKDLLFFEMIHSAFSHKRKRLAKNLECFSKNLTPSVSTSLSTSSNSADVSSNKVSNQYEKILEELGLDKNVRAEDVSIQTYIQLFERLI